MRYNASKNMWVTRGEHIGALLGGILSTVFEWVPRLLRGIWENIFLLILITLLGSFITAMCTMIYEKGTADAAYIKKHLAPVERTCLREYLPRVASDLKRPLSRHDVLAAQAECERTAEEHLQMQEQLPALGGK